MLTRQRNIIFEHIIFAYQEHIIFAHQEHIIFAQQRNAGSPEQRLIYIKYP